MSDNRLYTFSCAGDEISIDKGEAYRYMGLKKDYADTEFDKIYGECLREIKKNIFLIGDSIREGYCEIVKNEFLDKADVFYVNDNCRSTQYVIFMMKTWWNMFDNADKIDIVHFNCGHWDTAHFAGAPSPLTSEEEYAKNLRIILFLIRKFFKNAKIVNLNEEYEKDADLNNIIVKPYQILTIEVEK